MKLLIAINENNKLESKLSEHFGHCPYFAIYDTETKEVSYVQNIIDHSITQITPVDQIMKFNPDVIVTKGIGQRAIRLLKEKNVQVKFSDFSLLKDVIDNIDKLTDINLEDACKH